jgi:hypothetical protein
MTRILAAALAALLLSGTMAAADDPRDLTPAEEKAAPALAEKALKDRGLWQGKIYLTNLDVLLDEEAQPPDRYARLIYYRYDGDLGVIVLVHLGKLSVADVSSHPHMPTSLAAEELAAAEKIARADPEVKKALAKYKHLDRIEVDILVAQIVNPDVPGYQHRVARLFFRDSQRNYLPYVPMVDVDLTTGEVRLDVIRKLHPKG